MLVRQDAGQYAGQAASRCLPELPLAALAELVVYALQHVPPAAVRALRDRLRPA